MPRSERPPPGRNPAGTRAERLAIAPNRTPPAGPRYTGSPDPRPGCHSIRHRRRCTYRPVPHL